MKISGLILLLLALNAACITVSANQTLRTQNDSFPAVGVEKAVLETGAGSLTINGRSGLEEIEVSAEFRCSSGFASNSQRILDNLRLSMEVRGNTFYLKSEHTKTWNFGESGWINITINMPSGIEMAVKDGSGSILISGMDRSIGINDGSGSIELTNNDGSIHIKDGSGAIQVRSAQGDIDINDGSGSIDLKYLGASAQIQDGSGSIDVDDVRGDLIIHDDGSGSIHAQNIQRDVDINDGSGSIEVRHVGGNVQIHDGSGSISVTDVGGNLSIPRGGSGSINYSDIAGQVSVPEK
jgi:hypothetical protein